MDSEQVGARLRRWRLRRGLTQRVPPDLAGFSRGYVAQVETGRTPLDRRASLEAFAQALHISVDEVTGVSTAGAGPAAGAARIAGEGTGTGKVVWAVLDPAAPASRR
jgi:transcriptional regulator with XRE-family HTH domain